MINIYCFYLFIYSFYVSVLYCNNQHEIRKNNIFVNDKKKTSVTVKYK